MGLERGASIAVIGAGAAGLVTLRVLRDAGYHVVVFEGGNAVGGTWVYEDVPVEPDLARVAQLPGGCTAPERSVERPVERSMPAPAPPLSPTTGAEAVLMVQSSVYANLRTNLPKQVMQFSDFPFPDQLPSFMDHSAVQRYLVDYAEMHNLIRHIRFRTRVEAVEPLSPDVWSRYRVTFAEASNGNPHSLEFDAVCVCNGHYTTPQIPAEPFVESGKSAECIPGLTDGTFSPGVVRHSHYYREPTRYRGLRVLCLGSGPSGVDISIDIAQYARTPVYLSSRAVKQMPPDPQTGRYGVVEVPSLHAVIGPRSVLLADDTVLRELDVIMLCTGYRYVFPFLTSQAGVRITHQGRVVEPLYHHLIPVSRWTLPLIGIPFSVVPFPLFECQAHYIAAVFQGRVKLPGVDAMLAAIAEEKRVQQGFGQQAKHLHRLGDRQWAYNRQLADAAGVKGPSLAIQSVYNDTGTFRKLDPKQYRLREYRIFGDGPEDWEVQIRISPSMNAPDDGLRAAPTRTMTRTDEEAEGYSTGL